MTEESVQTVPDSEYTAPIQADNGDEYTGRIIRTIVAVLAGFLAGLICFLTDGMATGSETSKTFIFPFLILIAAIIIQKHVFMLLRIDTAKLEKKDWFYQGFMTFSFWFVTWTILLSGVTGQVA
ncbi:MAG TPA: hypothetical protein VN372_03470 [Methanospirillum sp.]|nr:hypothetical protein [Methanospirillum sp.]